MGADAEREGGVNEMVSRVVTAMRETGLDCTEWPQPVLEELARAAIAALVPAKAKPFNFNSVFAIEGFILRIETEGFVLNGIFCPAGIYEIMRPIQ